jgi:hypothetical protein
MLLLLLSLSSSSLRLANVNPPLAMHRSRRCRRSTRFR